MANKPAKEDVLALAKWMAERLVADAKGPVQYAWDLADPYLKSRLLAVARDLLASPPPGLMRDGI